MSIHKRKLPLLVKIVITLFVIVVLFAGSMFAKMQYEQAKMKPLKTGKVIPGIYAVNNGRFVNFYLIESHDGYVMIDAGNDQEQTLDQLNELGISLEEVKAVLLTHSDGDHVASLSLFPNAPVYLPEQEVQMIDGTTSRSLLGGNQLNSSYLTLKDDASVNLQGRTIQCIATPGHTPGSMSYLVDGKYLFVGDTLSIKDGKAALFNSFYNMNDDIQEASIQKLASRPLPEYIFTGHYGYSSDVGRAFDEWGSS